MSDQDEPQLADERPSATTLSLLVPKVGISVCCAAALSVGAVVIGFVLGLGVAAFKVTLRMMGVG